MSVRFARRSVSMLLACLPVACQRAASPSVAGRSEAATRPATATMPVTRPAAAGRLTIHVADLRNRTGDLVVGVFRSTDGFPSEQSTAVAWRVVPAAGDGTVTVDLPPGTYAASVLHDENGNGRIDKNFLGIPTEGYGVTNNPKPRRRAARFDEATFTLPARGTTVTISIQYSFT